MAFSQAQLDAIERAIATGSLTVEYSSPAGGSSRTTYRSLDELMRVRDLIRRELGQADGRRTFKLSRYSRGTT